jgi:uncharacterized protein YacL
MSVEFVFRLVGMVVFAILGAQSRYLFDSVAGSDSARLVIILTLTGAAVGLLLAPYLTTRPFLWLQSKLKQIPASKMVSGVIGLAIGLAVAALLYPSLSNLPSPYGSILPVAVSILFGYIGMAVMVMRQQDIFNLVAPKIVAGVPTLEGFGRKTSESGVLLDTSVIIDGRIADISQTGFIRSPMLIPGFVLNELQYIADSPDALRRNRGRRGLEVLKKLQEDAPVPVQITDLDVDGVKSADDKLVILAKQMAIPIITNDFNLNSVARLQGVSVLNVNELANAIKTVILPGEAIDIKIIQEGKERDQGVAYLSDGTMIVVENGRDFIGRNVQATVTKVLQTNAGKMIFARMED